MWITLGLTDEGEFARVQRDGRGQLPWSLYIYNYNNEEWEFRSMYPTQGEAIAEYGMHSLTRTFKEIA